MICTCNEKFISFNAKFIILNAEFVMFHGGERAHDMVTCSAYILDFLHWIIGSAYILDFLHWVLGVGC